MARKVGPKITFLYFVVMFSHMADSARIVLWRNTTLRLTTLDIMIQYLANIIRYAMPQIISIRWLDAKMIHSAVFHILHTCGVAITVRYITTS